MSQLKIVKYTNKSINTFEVRDEYGASCWIRFEQAGNEDSDLKGTDMSLQNAFKPIPIEDGY